MTMKELEDMRTSLQASLKTNVDNCHRLKDELKQLSEAVQDLGDKSKEELSFIAGRKCLDKIKESETYLKENCVKVQYSILFQENTDIEQYLLRHSGLGKIVEGSQSLALQLNPDKVITLKGKSEHDVHISSDTDQTCKITGICSLPSGQIVIVDKSNKRVKLLDHHYNVVSHCNVSGDPWDICHITSNDVAVGVEDGTGSVQFFSVHHGQLVNKGMFKLQNAVIGIAHHQGSLYISSRTALYHYTLTGTLVKKMYEDVSGGNTVWKCAVSPTGDRIHVTNYSQHKLLTFSPNGTLISTFTDPQLKAPWCVNVTPAGQVVVGWYRSKSIIQMDREGRRILATLATKTDVLGCPISVCFNSNMNAIIVGTSKPSKMLVLEVH